MCNACPRLVAIRERDRRDHPDWHAAPVPSVGPATARLLIVGLAPGRMGAHRTGRPFFGDDSGAWLYDALIRFGFATARGPGRAPRLRNCRITNAVRCLPPDNRPLPEERRRCQPHLLRDLGLLCRSGRRRRSVVILALGGIAHDAVLFALGRPGSAAGFGHGAEHTLAPGVHLLDSYHCSRYNTRTGRLTPSAFDAVFDRIIHLLS